MQHAWKHVERPGGSHTALDGKKNCFAVLAPRVHSVGPLLLRFGPISGSSFPVCPNLIVVLFTWVLLVFVLLHNY